MKNKRGPILAPVLAIMFFGGDGVAPLRQEDDYYYSEYDASEVFSPKKKVLPNKSPKLNVVEAPKQVSKPKTKVKANVFLGVSAFAVALTIVCRYAMINNMNMENIRLKKELDNINNANAQLQLAAERMVNLSEIEAYAKDQLGLQKPQNYQIEYINIDKQDLIDNKVVVDEKVGFREILSKIAEFFN